MGRRKTPPTNVEAIEAVIAALRDLGRFEDVDAARIQVARSLAEVVDAGDTCGECGNRIPGTAALWKQYREAEVELRRVEEAGDDRLARALGAMSTPMGDA